MLVLCRKSWRVIHWELNMCLIFSMTADPATASGSTVTFHVRLVLQQMWSLGKTEIVRFGSEYSKICMKIEIFPLSAKNSVLVL